MMMIYYSNNGINLWILEFRYTFFCQITTFIKVLCDLCFWARRPLTDRFHKNLSIKWSEVQKQRPHELL